MTANPLPFAAVTGNHSWNYWTALRRLDPPRHLEKATCLGAHELGYAVVLAADGHSSYSKDAARVIAEWNHKLSEGGVEVRPTHEVVFE